MEPSDFGMQMIILYMLDVSLQHMLIQLVQFLLKKSSFQVGLMVKWDHFELTHKIFFGQLITLIKEE